LREEHHGAYHASAKEHGDHQPTYALGLASSVAFQRPLPEHLHENSTGGSLGAADLEHRHVPQAYAKHLGTEPQVRHHPGAQAMVSDRAPEAVMERRRRRHLHKLLVDSAQHGGKPFNRKLLAGSLAEYGHERVTLAKLVGFVHQPGDLKDVGPPKVKGRMVPDHNPHVTYAKSKPKYGVPPEWRRDDLGPYDVDYSQTRARTAGYSPGHIRTINRQGMRPLPGSPSANTATPGAYSPANSAMRRPGTGGTGPGSPPRDAARDPVTGHWSPGAVSSTERRTVYANAVNEALRDQLELRNSRTAERAERRRADTQSAEVEGHINAFEGNLEDLKAKGWKGV